MIKSRHVHVVGRSGKAKSRDNVRARRRHGDRGCTYGLSAWCEPLCVLGDDGVVDGDDMSRWLMDVGVGGKV